MGSCIQGLQHRFEVNLGGSADDDSIRFDFLEHRIGGVKEGHRPFSGKPGNSGNRVDQGGQFGFLNVTHRFQVTLPDHSHPDQGQSCLIHFDRP